MAHVVRNKAGTRFTGYFEVKKEGKRHRISAGTFGTHAEALAAAEKAEALGAKPSVRPEDMTLRDWAERCYAADRKLSPRTKADYRHYMTKVISPVLGDKVVRDVTKADVKGLVDSLSAAGVSPAKLNRILCALAFVYRDLVDEDRLPVSPTAKVKIPRPAGKRLNVMDVEDYRAIRRNLPNGAKLFGDILLSTGLRFGEAAELRAKDFINRRQGSFLYISRAVQEAAGSGARFQVIAGTKGNWGERKSRELPLSQRQAKALADWITANHIGQQDLVFPKHLVLPTRADTENRVFLNTSGHLPRDLWDTVWRKAVAVANIGWYPVSHELRHAYASGLLDYVDPKTGRGYTVEEIRDLLGHSNIATTDKYLHALRKAKAGSRPSPFDSVFDEDEDEGPTGVLSVV